MPTITPASLRTAANAPRSFRRPSRTGFAGWHTADRAHGLDAGIRTRQENARKWRAALADAMEAAGVTALRSHNFRRFVPGCRTYTVTAYLHADDSPFAYRVGQRIYTPSSFEAIYPYEI
jgi:hypothetical protein